MKILFLLLISLISIQASEELALKKIKKFGKNLQKELKGGLRLSPLKAIEICQMKAPEIEKQVSSEGIKIGRVSLKKRNPQNAPKAWMRSYIKEFHEKKISKNYIITDLNNGKKGLLKPIRTMPLCLKCHGENIDKSLYRAILNKYPKDRAIGYKVGEIRGFFWAEY